VFTLDKLDAYDLTPDQSAQLRHLIGIRDFDPVAQSPSPARIYSKVPSISMQKYTVRVGIYSGDPQWQIVLEF
jgi:hypothetical protein